MQVNKKMTSTVRFNASSAIKTSFQQHYSPCIRNGSGSQRQKSSLKVRHWAETMKMHMRISKVGNI